MKTCSLVSLAALLLVAAPAAAQEVGLLDAYDYYDFGPALIDADDEDRDDAYDDSYDYDWDAHYDRGWCFDEDWYELDAYLWDPAYYYECVGCDGFQWNDDRPRP
jgi:hypothetical protein